MAKKKKKEQASWASTYLKNREKEAKAYATKANQRQLANDIIASNDDELARYSTQGLTSQAKWKNDQLENDAVNLRRKYSDRQVRSYVADTNNNLTAQEENLDSINRFYRTLPLEQKARSLGYSNGLQYATYGRGLNQLKNDAYTMNMNRIQQKYDGNSYMDLLGAKAEKNNDDEASYLSQRKNQIPKAEKQKELDRINKELQGEADVVKDIEAKASKNLISPEQVDSMYEESQKKSATLREQKSAIEADLQTDEKIANTKKQSEYYEKLRNSSDFEKNKSYKSDDSVLGDIANGVLGFMREGDFHKVIGGEADPITISKDENLYLAANNMTSDQKDMYNYLYNTKGKEEADKYVTTIQDQINYDTAKEIESDLRDNPLGKYAYAAITAPGNTIENIKSIMNGAVSDTPRPTAQNKYFSQIARENMGTAEKLGYDIVENTANMTIPILASAVTGGTAGAVLGAGLTGASAGGETFNQAWKEGYSKEQAAAYGALSGASEAGLQYVLGGITKLGGKVSNGVVNRVASKVDNAIGQAVIKQVGSSASEFTEEYLQDVIDPVFRNVVFGEDNEVKFFSTDALYSGILGALTAGVMEAPSNVTSALYERNAYRKIGQSAEQTQIADSIVETANNSNDTSVKKALETYNENETSYNLGKLRLATDNDIASPISNATNAEEVQQAYEEVITNNQSQYARNIAKEASYDKLMELGQPDYAKIYQPESLENLSEATQYDSLPDTEDFAEDISDYAITEEDTVVPTKTSKHFVAHDSKGQQIDIAEVSSLENEKESYVTADGNTVPMNTVQLDNVEQQRLINQSIKLVGNDVNGLNTMVKNFTPDIQSEYGEGAYFSAIQHFYHAGKTGKISINTMLDKYNTRNLPGNVLREAYNAGIDYAKVENKVSEPTKNSKAKLNDDTYVYYEKGQVRTTNDTIIRDLKEEEHEPVNDLLRLISKKTGITTEATKAKSEVNGYFDKASGNIVVNVLNGKGIQTSIHELGEFTLAWNRKGMEDVQSAIANWYAESKGYASLDDALTKYQETYEKYDGEKTYQSALDEFVNDAMSGLFTDEKSMKEFLLFLDSDGVEVTKRAGILDRLLEIYDKIVSKIKEYLDKSTLSDVARNTAEMELEKQAEIRQLIYDAINQASENYKNAEDTSSTAVKKQFSLDTDIEETKDLIAIHNLSESKLIECLKLGGFPCPSIAITKDSIGHTKFGEISVLFGKDTINPDVNKNNKVYGADAWTPMFPQVNYKYKEDAIMDISSKLGLSESYVEENLLKGSIDNAKYNIKNADQAKEAFVEAKGYEVKEHEAEFDEYVDSLLDGSLEKKGIRNEKDYITGSGERRTFEQLHYDYNLDNFVKAMGKENDAGAGYFMAGFGNMQGVSAKKYNSFSDVKNDSKRLVKLSEEEAKKRISDLRNRFIDVASKIARSGDNSFITVDQAQTNIVEAIRNNKTADGIYNELKKYNPKTTKEDVNEIISIANSLREMPVTYFEAKPKRAVRFDEVEKIVIPIDSSNELIESLKENGVHYSVYDTESEREKLVNSDEKIKFSLDVPVEETKDLIAIHNIFEDQFMKILDIGGFAAPSIAVIRKDMTHATFGEISVVFGKDTIDPMLHQKNKIFRGDAWTETVPKGVEVKTPVELLKALRVEMDEYTAYTNFESAVNHKATYGALNEVRRDKSRLKDSIDSLHEHRRERAMSSTLMQIAIELNGKEKSYTTMEDLVNITELGSDKEMLAKLQETYPHASMKTINDLNALRKTILESDVPYFEAKPYRVINFKEIKNIVIPETASNELKNKLESLALHYVEYTDTADRIKKVNEGNFAFSVDVDLRKSLDVNANATMDLLKENEQLKKANELLKQEFKLTHGCIPNRNSVDVIASKLIRECKSTYSKDKLADRISKLFTYAHKHNSQNDEVLKIMTEILKPVADQSTIIDSSMSVQYKGFKDYLRNKGIRLSDEQKSEIGNSIYDSYDEFRKKNFGSIKTRNDGTYLEQEWADLCEDYKGLLDPNEPVSSMPEALLDALDTIKPIFMNGKNAESMAYDMALSAFDMYFNIKPIETYADKNLKKLNSIRNEYKANVKKLKQKYGEYVTRYYKEMADKNNNIRSELSKARAQAAYNKKLRNEMVERKKSGQIQKEKREIIRSTRRVVDRLMKKAITPTDKRHIPEPLLKSIVDLGSALDFFDSDKGMNASNLEWMETEKKLLKLQTELKNIDSEAEGYEELSLGFDPDIIGKVNEFVSNINTTKNINDMTIQELRLFNEAINAISKCITEADILHSNELFNRVSDIGKSTLDEFMFMNNKKDLNPILEKFNTLLNVNMLDSRSFFHRLGKSAESVYKSIRKGFDVWVGRFEESQKYMNEVVDPKECKSWSDGSVVLDCQTSSGKMQMTPAQLMNLYVLYKRPQAREHILRGGFSVTAINHKLQRKTFHIDVSSLRSNFDKLTDRQKEVAEKMQNYLASECADWGNETSMTLYGYKKFTDVDYFPIKVKKDTTTVNSNNQENTQAGFYSIKNMGASKNVVEGAMNPLEIADIFDVFTNHVVEMANYNAYALPLLDAMKWYGYKEIDTKYDEDSRNVYSPLNDEMKHNGLYDVLANKDRTSFKYYNTVRSEIGRVYGNNMRAYFEEFIKSVNGSTQISNDEEFSHMLLSLWKPARVGANIRVAIQQPTAYCRAAMVMDPKYLLKAIPIATKNKVKGRSAADIAEDNSAIAKWKSWGYYDTMIGRSFKEIITGQHTTLNKIREKSMVLAEKGDRMTWGTIWTACELEVKDNHPELDSDEFTEAVKNRFDEVIDKTQVVDSILHRSKLMRSKSGLVKLETAFMAEPTKSYNMLLNTLHDTYRNGFSEATKKKVARAVAVFTFTGVVNAMAQSLVDVLRDDDKEYWETVLDNASSNVNPLSLIPWIKNLVTIVQGYDVGRGDVEALSSVMETANKLTDIVEKISNGEFEVNFTSIYSLANTLLKAISDVTGLPIQNVSRDAFAVASKFNEKGRLRKYIAKYDYDNLYESLVDDNKEEIKKYRDKLEKNGKTNKEIEDAIRKRLSDDSEEIEKAASLRKSGDIDGYMKILNELKKKGFSQDTLVKAVNSLMVEKKDTSKATEPSKVDAISNRDLIIAVENGKDIDKVISMIADQCEGKTDKEIRSKLKSILTNNYKKQYEAAKSPSEKIAIKNKLYKIGYKGQLYTGKDFARWDKK